MNIVLRLATSVSCWYALSATSVASGDDFSNAARHSCQLCATETVVLDQGEDSRSHTKLVSVAAESTDKSSAGLLGVAGLSWVFDTSRYPPRWNCGNWSAAIGWLHIVSDLLTWLAYLAIPAMLVYFARKRKEELPFNRLFWLFGAFILFCGTTHLMEAIIFWWPAYGLSGVIKFATASVSVITAIALSYAIPVALQFKSPKQLEEKVFQRTQQLEIARAQAVRIIEASPVGMIMVNQDGIIVLTNDAAERLFGYPRDELQGSPVEMLFPEHAGFQNDPRRVASTSDMGRGGESFGVHKSGDEVPIEIGLNSVVADGGDCVLFTVVDLRERRKSAAEIRRHATQLSRANEDLERFAYVASHDLKSPLRAIDNLSKWVIADVGRDLPEKSKKHLEALRSRVQRMEGLLTGLLDYSRAGRSAHRTELIDCQALVHETVDTLDIPEQINVDIGCDMPIIHGSKSALQQVLMNLIGNAVKHHDLPNGTVKIEAVDLDSVIQFTIEDNGPGIPEELHQRAFEAFQTLRSRDEVEGSGLGLAIVKRVVEREGGRIELESTVGEGCHFRIMWPKDPISHKKTSLAEVV